MSVDLNVGAWDYRGKVQGFTDGEVLDLGRHKLRFLETPHVHHWDSMMLFEETTRSVFPSDLYIQPGDQPPVVTEDLGAAMCELYRGAGILAHEEPVRRVVDRLELLKPKWMQAMHGGTIAGEAIPYYTRALREQPFAYQGMLLGRSYRPDLAARCRPPEGSDRAAAEAQWFGDALCSELLETLHASEVRQGGMTDPGPQG